MNSKTFKTANKSIYLLSILFLVIGMGLGYWLLSVCSKNPSTIFINGIDIKVEDFVLKKLEYESLPQGYTGRSIIPLEDLREIVELPTLEYKGEEGYHPVRISRLLLALLNSYKATGEQAYLEKAEFISDKYIHTAIESNGAIFFPYTFDFYLHGIKDELMKAPWYSGMAQGISLSAYVRFYQITKDQKYLEIADKIFKSFTNFKNNGHNPWIVYVDKNGYYWVEEYPIWPPANTLNGFIFGIYGLYEYWLLKQDNESERVLKVALTTIKHYIAKFRNPGSISFYCLKHEVQSERYHKLHIEQLENLYQITKDRYFKEMADTFRLDH